MARQYKFSTAVNKVRKNNNDSGISSFDEAVETIRANRQNTNYLTEIDRENRHKAFEESQRQARQRAIELAKTSTSSSSNANAGDNRTTAYNRPQSMSVYGGLGTMPNPQTQGMNTAANGADIDYTTVNQTANKGWKGLPALNGSRASKKTISQEESFAHATEVMKPYENNSKAMEILRRYSDLEDSQDRSGMLNFQSIGAYSGNFDKLANQFIEETGVSMDEFRKIAENYSYLKHNEQREEAKAKKKEQNAAVNLAQGVGEAAASVVTNYQGLIGAMQNPNDPELGRDYNSPFMKHLNAQEDTKEAFEAKTENLSPVAKTLANLGYDLAVTGTQSEAAALTGEVGLGSFAAGGYASNLKESDERGLTEGQAQVYSAVSGGLEYITERLPIEHLKKIYNGSAIGKSAAGSLKPYIKAALEQMGEEASEELINGIADTVADGLINGDKSKVNATIQNNINNGMSEDEATRSAYLGLVKDTGYSMLVAALSTGVSAGPALAGQARASAKAGRDIAKDNAYLTRDTNSPFYISEDRNAYVADEDYKQAQDARQTILNASEKVDKGQRISGKEARAVYEKAAKALESLNARRNVEVVKAEESITNTSAEKEQVEYKAPAKTNEQIIEDIEFASTPYQLAQAIDQVTEETDEIRELIEYKRQELEMYNFNSSDVDNAVTEKKALEMGQRGEQVTEEQLNAIPEADRQKILEANNQAFNKSVLAEHPNAVVDKTTGKYFVPAEVKVEGADVVIVDSEGNAHTDYENPKINQAMSVVTKTSKDARGHITDQSIYQSTSQQAAYAVELALKSPEATSALIKTAVEAIYDSASVGHTSFEEFEKNSKGLFTKVDKTAAKFLYNAVAENARKSDARKTENTAGKKASDKAVSDTLREALPEETTALLEALSEKIGYNFVASTNKNARGSINPGTRQISIGTNSVDEVWSIVAHEAIGEYLQAHGNEADVLAIQDDMFKYLEGKLGSDAFNDLINQYQSVYRTGAREGSVDYGKSRRAAANEMFNDTIFALLSSEEGVKDYVSWLNEGHEKSFFEKVKDFFSKLVQSIRDYIDTGSFNAAERAALEMDYGQAKAMRDRIFKAMDAAIATVNYTGVAAKKNSITPENLERSSKYVNTDKLEDILIDHNYIAAVDDELLDFANDIEAGTNTKKEVIVNSKVSDKLANAIEDIVGFDVSDFEEVVGKNAITHIFKKHGKHGKSDQSMSDNNDIARIGYILKNYDEIGEGKGTRKFHNTDGSNAKTVVIMKKIGDKYHYVVEAVPDTNSHRLQIISAYINEKDTLPRVANPNGFAATSETDTSDSASLSTFSLTSEKDKSTDNLSKNDEEIVNDSRKSISVDSDGNSLSEGQQEYFADSKIRDDQGRLKVMYHGTQQYGFTVFDKKKAKGSGYYGRGFYFSSEPSHAGQYGEQYKVYLNITNPMQSGDHNITKDQLRAFVEAVAEDEDYGIENYGYDATVDSVTDDIWSKKDDFAMLQDINAACVGDFVAAVKLFNEINGTDYDGIVVPTETVAFESNQIKNVDNLNPTNDEDIRYSKKVIEMQKSFAKEFDAWDKKNNVKRFVIGRTNNVLQSLGVPEQDIELDSKKLIKIMSEHPEMSEDVIKHIPDVANDPILIMDSKNSDRLVCVGELQDTAGDNVIVVLELHPKNRKGVELDVIKVASAYGKTGLQNLINQSNIRYITPDKKRISQWRLTTRLQLPVVSSMVNSNLSIPSTQQNATAISSGNDGRNSIKVDWDNHNIYKLPNRTYEDDIFFLGTDEEIEAAEKQDITAKAYVANIIHSKDFAGLMFKDSVGIDRLLTRSTRKEWDWQLSESRNGEPIGHENYKEENDDITSYDTWPDKTMAALYNEIINELPKSDARIYVIREGIAEDTRNSIKVYGEASPYADSINETKVISTMLGSMNNSLSQVDAFNVSNDAYMQIEKSILKKYNAQLEEGELAANVSFAFAYMQQNKLETNYDKMMNYLLNIGDEVIKNSNLKDPESEQLYNSAKDVVKRYTFKLSEADREEIKTAFGGNWKTAFGELQKAGIKLNNDKGVDIDTVFSQLQSEFLQSAGINLEKYDKPSEQILGLLDAMHALEPTAYLWDGANSMDKALTVVADIINDYYSIATGQLASNVVKGTKKGKETVAAAINKEKDRLNQRFRDYKAEKIDEFNQIVAEKNRIIQEQQNQIRQQNEQMKKWNAELSDKDKQIQQAKVLTEKQIKQTAKLQAREAVESYRQREERARQIENIKKTGVRLIKWLNNPTDNQHVPAFLQKPLGEFLAAIDFLPKNAKADSKSTLTWQQRMQSLRDTLVKIKDAEAEADGSVEAYFAENMIAKELISMMDDFLGKETWDEFTQSYIVTKRAASKVSLLDAKDLATLNKIMSALSASINNMNKTYANSVFKEVSKLAKASVKEIDALPAKKARTKAGGTLEKLLRYDELEPITYFENLGNGAKSVFDELRQGFNVKTRHVREADEYMSKVKEDLGLTDIKMSDWKNQTKVFNLSEGKVELTVTQIMSLYEILNRKQGKPHVAIGGIKAGDVYARDENGKFIKKNKHQAKAVHILSSEAQAIIKSLTDEQRALADAMQKFMANECSSWGNRVTEKMFGYKKFEEKDYFPLKTDSNTRATTASSDNNVSYYSIKNSSFTKPITPMANNAVVIDDIFDIFTDHVVKMADYDAYVMPIADAMRWFNYSEKTINAVAPDELNESGQRVDYIGNMQESIDRAMGSEGLQYFRQFIKDINGDYAGRGGVPDALNSLMGMYKAAAVGANIRVVIQQPTAIIRAADVIETEYLVKAYAGDVATLGVRAMKYAKKAQANSEIAYWKAQGYYETYLGQSFKEIITGDKRLRDWLTDAAGWAAGKADDLSWGTMYHAAELKVQKTMPQLKVDSAEYTKEVVKIFEDIVDHTQVVDTIFHKSQYMRNQGLGYKITSAFMAEPTKTYNMIYRAYYDSIYLKKGKKYALKKLSKVALIFVIEQLVNSIGTALWDSLRDDEKESYLAGLKSAFLENSVDNLLLLNLVPISKDIVSFFHGYDATSYIYDGLENLINTILADKKYVMNYIHGEKQSKTLYGISYQNVKALSQLSGIPFANVMRDVTAIYNTINDSWGGDDLYKTESTKAKAEKNKETKRISKVFETGDLGLIKSEITNTYNNAIADGKTESDAWKAAREMLKSQYKIMVEANPDDKVAINNRFRTLLKYTKESNHKGGYKTPSDKEISNWIEKWNKPKE